MMIKTGKYICFILVIFVLASCGTTVSVKKQKLSKAEDTYVALVKDLTAEPVNPELAADLKIKVGTISLDATLKMRWNESIRISIAPLGIMEVMRLECLPDMVVLVDRTSQQYAVEHYADVPYRNFTGIDFYTLQALLWNKVFVPGYTDMELMMPKIKLSKADENGVVLNSTEYNYMFDIDKTRHLVKTYKEGLGYKVAVNYLDFKPVADGVVLPLKLALDLQFTGNSDRIEILLDDVSVEKADWPNRLSVSNRFKRASIKEILDKFSL